MLSKQEEQVAVGQNEDVFIESLDRISLESSVAFRNLFKSLMFAIETNDKKTNIHY